MSSDIPVLEAGIHHRQVLYEGMCQAYTEVHSTSNELLNKGAVRRQYVLSCVDDIKKTTQ